MAMHGSALDRRLDAMSNGDDFGSAKDSLRGRSMSATPGTQISKGKAPLHVREALDACTVIYVVWSYATPIAWITTDGEVVIPAHRYSNTTTNHQTYCRRGLGS